MDAVRAAALAAALATEAAAGPRRLLEGEVRMRRALAAATVPPRPAADEEGEGAGGDGDSGPQPPAPLPPLARRLPSVTMADDSDAGGGYGMMEAD